MTGAQPSLPALEAVLEKAAHENFRVAPGFLPNRLRADLTAIYGYARFVDDVGDETGPAGEQRLALLDLVDADLSAVFEGRQPRLPAVVALTDGIHGGRFTEEPLRRLVEANRLDQRATRYATFDDLRYYCTLSADPVGRLVLGAIGLATPERVALSDQVCTGLQLVEHWQDVAEDFARGRIYLPQEDLHQFGVTEDDLAAPRATPSLRSLIAFESARARGLLDAGVPLTRSIPGRAKVAIAGFVGGGRAALGAIAAVRYDVLPGAPKATKTRLARGVVGVLLSSVKRSADAGGAAR